MDFDQNSIATTTTTSTTKQQDAMDDIRASTIMRSRRPTSVKLEDFEIKM